MKKIIFSAVLGLLMTSCNEKGLNLTVTNPSDFDRLEDVLELPLANIEQVVELKDGEMYAVVSAKGDTLASQVTYDGKFLFQPQLAANESKTFQIVSAPKREFDSRVNSLFFARRSDDFVWENDKVGFRFYGAALKKIQAPSNGLDLWYKRTNKIVLDEWYRKAFAKEASFHDDHGEGCDPYAVGHTLGAGSMSPYVDNQLLLNENFDSYEILENGPLRTTFKLVYPRQTINEKVYVETKVISLDAGSQYTRIEQSYINEAADDTFTVAAGIVKRPSGDSLLYTKGNDYMVYKEPNCDINGQIFLGVIIPQGINDVFVDSYIYNNPMSKKAESLANTLATTTYKVGSPIVYYTGFGWNKFGFDKVEDFDAYTSAFSKGLNEPLTVTYR